MGRGERRKMLVRILLLGIAVILSPVLLWVAIAVSKHPKRSKKKTRHARSFDMDYCKSAESDCEVKKDVPLQHLLPPDDELTNSPYNQRVMKMRDRDYTPDDADTIKDLEYLRYVQEQELIDAELDAQMAEDENMMA